MTELQGLLRRGDLDYGLLGRRISERRNALGLGLREAADQCGGISYSTLSRLEHGSARPDLETLKRVLSWLDLPASALFMGAQPIRAHLRAQKNLASEVAAALGDVAGAIRSKLALPDSHADVPSSSRPAKDYRRLSHQRREDLALRFRSVVGIDPEQALDPFLLDVQGARVTSIDKFSDVPKETAALLMGAYSRFWSAMTIPLDDAESDWLIVLNSSHKLERQRATLMEEICHILLGHNLCTLSHIEGQTFRDYDADQESDAYGLGAAILVPKPPLVRRVRAGEGADAIAKHFRVSAELAEYRIKRTGAWYEYKLQQVRTK